MLPIHLLADSPDERWPSMDLVAQMHSAQLNARGIRHTLHAPAIRRLTPNHTLNRLWFRFADYPSQVTRLPREEIFHILDHSYSQLLHALPPHRTVVTCHDLDTFRCLLEPARAPRGPAFRAMTRRILSGFRLAAHAACDSAATYNEIRKFDLLPSSRLSVVPLGVHPSCSPDPDPPSGAQASQLLNQHPGPLILHVGSTLPRKRIDLVLRTFAAAHDQLPGLRLVRVGGPLTPAQRDLARELSLEGLIFEMPFLDRPVLAALYRRAALVLMPSDAEGFGLPVAEAMACGTPVLASDLPVLREVGGDTAFYAPPGDPAAFAAAVTRILRISKDSLRSSCLQQAADFSWVNYTNRMLDVYNGLLNR